MQIYTHNQRQLAHRIEEEASRSSWTDWKWHMRNSVRSIDDVERLLGITFPAQERTALQHTVRKFPLAITPYYLSLVDASDYRNDPIFMQAFPSVQELRIEHHDMGDPLHEDADSPVPNLVHRYPDRVLLHVSNTCAMYCRHCTRKRKVGDRDGIPTKEELRTAIDYIKETPRVRDVLLSGGDPFLLPDAMLDWLLGEITGIEHVEVVRIGTRTPVVLPYRITDDLIHMLKKYHPVWINTHFNHPAEVTASARQALARLADAGIPLGNQSVLLAGVNDCPRLIKVLNHKLVQSRVRPYYLYQCDMSEGLTHFRTPIGKGIEIMESLRGHTSGFAVPTYVVDAPGGGGKIPVAPNYILSWTTNKVVLRNFEGVITTYHEPEKYESTYCNRECTSCNLQLKEADAEERAVGIERLLADWDETLSLTPEETERMERRSDVA